MYFYEKLFDFCLIQQVPQPVYCFGPRHFMREKFDPYHSYGFVYRLCTNTNPNDYAIANGMTGKIWTRFNARITFLVPSSIDCFCPFAISVSPPTPSP